MYPARQAVLRPLRGESRPRPGRKTGEPGDNQRRGLLARDWEEARMSAQDMAAGRGGGSVTASIPRSEVRKVVFASSLGTVFEWYDFYLYATLAPFFAALFFPKENDDRCAAVGLRDLCGRLPGAPVRRDRVRPGRRPGGTQIHLPRHHPGHGLLDLRGRPAADLRDHRLVGADSAGDAAPGCRAWRSAASMAARRPMSPSIPRIIVAATRRAWIQTTATLGFFLSLLVIGICRFSGMLTPEDFAVLGLAHSVPGVADPAGLLGLYPAEAQ